MALALAWLMDPSAQVKMKTQLGSPVDLRVLGSRRAQLLANNRPRICKTEDLLKEYQTSTRVLLTIMHSTVQRVASVVDITIASPVSSLLQVCTCFKKSSNPTRLFTSPRVVSVSLVILCKFWRSPVRLTREPFEQDQSPSNNYSSAHLIIITILLLVAA